MKKETFRYRILVEWSDEDQAFIARVPALPGCLAHGATAEKAAHEAEVAAGLILDVMKEDRRTPPPIDAVADYSGQLRLRLPKSLHEAVSQLATAEGVSLNTLMLSLIAEGCGRREAHLSDAAEGRTPGQAEGSGLVARKRGRLPHHMGTVYQRGPGNFWVAFRIGVRRRYWRGYATFAEAERARTLHRSGDGALCAPPGGPVRPGGPRCDGGRPLPRGGPIGCIWLRCGYAGGGRRDREVVSS